MKLILAVAIAYASMASAFCHNSVTCTFGGNDLCNWTCKRDGNPSGGRCLPRDGCPGYDICACYPKSKRSGEVIDGDETLNEVFKPVFQMIDDMSDVANNVEERSEESSVEKRSVCCSLLDPFKGLCCEAHCDYIGKNGGQCSDKGVCTCN